MEQNTKTVQEVEDDLDVNYEAQLAEIDKALEENAQQMAEIEKALSEINKRKIFTLKELKEMELEKERKERERIETEKREIDKITSRSLKEAQLLRDSAKTQEQKTIAEAKAIDIELSAISHDLEIRKMILSESENKLEDVLASLAIEESKFQKNKKASFMVSKKSGEYYKLREEIYKNKSRKGSYLDRYLNLSKVIEKQMIKIFDANKMLRVINAKLKVNYQ